MGKLFAFACATSGIHIAVTLFALMHTEPWTPGRDQGQGAAPRSAIRAPLDGDRLERNRSGDERGSVAMSRPVHVCVRGQ